MSITLLLTGGTIEKHYDEKNGSLVFNQSQLPAILELGRVQADIHIEQILLKDSLDITEAERKNIIQACVQNNSQKILITHGTDTMVDTAHLLAAQTLDKTIILTGAMVPFSFKHSDALFNTGFALAAVQTLPFGVYIAMNGKIFNWDNVKKNRELGIFEALP